jgi:NADH-quinone oxidoreductase subunit G
MDVNTAMLVDGAVVPVQPGQNLLETCLHASHDVPYFCWHPALGAVGSCRQCAVKVFDGPADTTGKIVMACMTKATPGMLVSVKDTQAAAFREQVVEMVLTSHPHDCPVCEVGGECHLQDMAVLTGHAVRRYRFTKRTHLNQDLGPFIKHEMNRCIGCYRCLRFYRDYASGDDFGVFGANRNVYFGRAESGALESPFAGNLVEICPTGVFVDKPFSEKFRRKWDMRATPSVCPHCAVGCNITVHERGGEMRRVVNRVNESLNGFFLCDRGRFGTGFVDGPARLRHGTQDAETKLADMLRQDGVIGIGSPRASLEANFALRALVGPEKFFAGVSAQDGECAALAIKLMQAFGTQAATVADARAADAVLVLGDDPLAVAPILGLALLQAAKQAGTFVVATPAITGLDKVASRVVRAAPSQILQLTFASGAEFLRAAKNPLLVVGGAACGPDLLRAAANILGTLRDAGIYARFCVLLPEANSLGLAMMGAKLLASVQARHAIVLENDLVQRGCNILTDAKLAVLDHVRTATVARAEVVLPVGSFADVDGTNVNFEGRAQRSFKAVFGAVDPPAAWHVLRDAGIASGRLDSGAWPDHAAVLDAMADMLPALAGCVAASPPAHGARRPASLPLRYSGRTAETADVDVREPAPPQNPDSPFSTTMEGMRQMAPGVMAPNVSSPGWNSVQSAVRQMPGTDSIFLFAGSVGEMPAFAVPDLPPPGVIFVATPDVFASDELAALSPAIAARISAPRVTLAPADAVASGLTAGDAVVCQVGNLSFKRVLVVNQAAAGGVAAVSSGLPGEAPLPFGCSGTISLAP